MQTKVLFVVLLALAGAGCEKSSDPAGEVASIDLTVGSAWTYRWHLEQFAPDGTMLWDTTSQFIVVVVANNQMVGNYQGLTLLEVRDRDRPSGTTEIWYSQSGDRLTEVAYRSPSHTPIVLPKRTGVAAQDPRSTPPISPLVSPWVLRKHLVQASVADSIQIREDPRIVYVYPLSVGAAWVAFTSPFHQEREVEAYEDLSSSGTTFHCARIRTTIPHLAPGLEWIDHVSVHGLVKRTFDSWVVVSDPSGSPTADSVRVIESIDLVAH